MVKSATYGFAMALLAAASAANAESVTSTVRSFDASQQVLVIDDGRSFAVQPGPGVALFVPAPVYRPGFCHLGCAEFRGIRLRRPQAA